MSIKDRPVVLVTRASSGMGKDFALRLIAEGYTIYGAARRIDRMDALGFRRFINLARQHRLARGHIDKNAAGLGSAERTFRPERHLSGGAGGVDSRHRLRR